MTFWSKSRAHRARTKADPEISSYGTRVHALLIVNSAMDMKAATLTVTMAAALLLHVVASAGVVNANAQERVPSRIGGGATGSVLAACLAVVLPLLVLLAVALSGRAAHKSRCAMGTGDLTGLPRVSNSTARAFAVE